MDFLHILIFYYNTLNKLQISCWNEDYYASSDDSDKKNTDKVM